MNKQAFVMIGRCMIEVGYENLNVRITKGNTFDARGVIQKIVLGGVQNVTFFKNPNKTCSDTHEVDVDWLEVVQ